MWWGVSQSLFSRIKETVELTWCDLLIFCSKFLLYNVAMDNVETREKHLLNSCRHNSNNTYVFNKLLEYLSLFSVSLKLCLRADCLPSGILVDMELTRGMYGCKLGNG